MYDPVIGRWTSPDPKHQYASPYVGMGNDWANQVDPDGAYSWFGAAWRNAWYGGGGIYRGADDGGGKEVWGFNTSGSNNGEVEITAHFGKNNYDTQMQSYAKYGVSREKHDFYQTLAPTSEMWYVNHGKQVPGLGQNNIIFDAMLLGGPGLLRKGGAVVMEEIATETGAQIGTKLEYVFGKATGSVHNIERSTGMLRQLESVGIFDNAAGRSLLNSHLESAYSGAKAVLQPNGRYLRESLLMGPNGGLKVESIWEGGKLITVKLLGGR